MELIDFTIRKIEAVKNTISKIKECEFPYVHSKEAVINIETIFDDLANNLESVKNLSNKELVPDICSRSLEKLYECLPLLGFILRSTEVRNAFEIHGPLLRLSQKILGNDTKLVISSEWDYYPYMYHNIPGMQGYVLIGLPSSESSNPLLIPLAGHELGHGLWFKNNLESENCYGNKLTNIVIQEIMDNHWNIFAEINHITVQKDSFSWEDTSNLSKIASATAWVKKQAEESFCDFVGLYIFGVSFLYAFSYLLAPGDTYKKIMYPDNQTRYRNLLYATKKYSLVFNDYDESIFQKEIDMNNLSEEIKFQLMIANIALTKIIDELIDEAKKLLDQIEITSPDKSKIDEIKRHFIATVPSRKSGGVSNILNAAWDSFLDDQLWSQQNHLRNEDKYSKLKELILKSIEIFELECRMH